MGVNPCISRATICGGISVLKHSGYLILLLALTACVSHPYDEHSEYTRIPAGSSLTLNQSIHIAANSLSVYMQDGNIKPYSTIDKYYPHCKFELYTLSENARTVQPDTFKIVRVVDDTDMSSLQPPMYASLRIADSSSDGGPSVVSFTTSMYLKSKTQSDVYRMTCMHWDLINESRYLSIAEMRNAMGNVFTLTAKTTR
jgi:hypothetical protein